MLERICNEKKSVLKEVTTEKLNQLDYIFIDERMIKISYSASNKNFISDHKSITIRIPFINNEFSELFKTLINFEEDHHQNPLKKQKNSEV